LKREISPCSGVSEHNLFQKIIDICEHPIKPQVDSTCDEVFAFYIFNVACYTKRECFKNYLKILDLFREFLNKFNKNMVKTKHGIWIGVEYSQVYNAVDVPEISNDFSTQYLICGKGIFGLSKREAIEFIYNLCLWLFNNEYSCNKLILIDF